MLTLTLALAGECVLFIVDLLIVLMVTYLVFQYKVADR